MCSPRVQRPLCRPYSIVNPHTYVRRNVHRLSTFCDVYQQQQHNGNVYPRIRFHFTFVRLCHPGSSLMPSPGNGRVLEPSSSICSSALKIGVRSNSLSDCFFFGASRSTFLLGHLSAWVFGCLGARFFSLVGQSVRRCELVAVGCHYARSSIIFIALSTNLRLTRLEVL